MVFSVLNQHFLFINSKKVSIPETTVWYNMTNVCNMSYKSARPHPYLGDKEKQEEFKKKD